MTTNAVVRGTHTVSPYLVVHQAEKVVEFLKQAFGAEEVYLGKRTDGTLEHAEVSINESLIEISHPGPGHAAMPMMLHLYVEDADRVYGRAIAAGGISLQSPVDQPYGDREAGVQDPGGNYWWISTHQSGSHHIPEGLRDVTIGLNPHGASEMIAFLRNVFGAYEVMHRRSPDGTVGHAKLRIGDTEIEVSDAHEPFKTMPGTIRLFLNDVDELYARALKAGAKSVSVPEEKPYGEYNAGVSDAWGNTWYIARVLNA